MTERLAYIPTRDQILSAEAQRTKGKIKEAAIAMRPAVAYPLDTFGYWPIDTKQRLLMASRIYVVSNGTLANSAWEAPKVAHHLGEQRQAIVDVYRNEQVQGAHITTDTEGNPYDFATEMARDEVADTVTLAALTGNSRLLDGAITQMDTIIAAAIEPTAKTLAQFEQQRLIHQKNPTQETFGALTQRFQEAVKESSAAKNWDRVATLGGRYGHDAALFGNVRALFRGTRVGGRASFQDGAITIAMFKEIGKAKTDRRRRESWKRTKPAGIDYSSLALPEKTK